MKSTVAPSLRGIIIAGLIGLAIAASILWVRAHHGQEIISPQSTPMYTPDMSGETEAENLPDVTPLPTSTGTLPEKG